VASLGREVPQLVERAYTPPAEQPRLANLLRAEIQQNLLEVRSQGATETIVLREGLFPSGSGEIARDKISLLGSVGQALNRLSGPVLITGHTDDVPIATLRFPSNWQLSERRAEAVREVLIQSVAPERLASEARADSEPLVPNTSAANRALNRRVEITLLPSPTRE
jgi:type VI secretion system protein ImpK